MLPETLPLGLNFVERVGPVDRLLLMLRSAIRDGVCDAGAATVAEPERKRTSSDGSNGESWRVRGSGPGWEGKRHRMRVWRKKEEMRLKVMSVEHLDWESGMNCDGIERLVERMGITSRVKMALKTQQ